MEKLSDRTADSNFCTLEQYEKLSNSLQAVITEIKVLKSQVSEIDDLKSRMDTSDAVIKEKIIALEDKVILIKQEMLSLQKEFMDKLWKLINNGVKIIVILIIVIVTLAGVKILPDIFSTLGGM